MHEITHKEQQLRTALSITTHDIMKTKHFYTMLMQLKIIDTLSSWNMYTNVCRLDFGS